MAAGQLTATTANSAGLDVLKLEFQGLFPATYSDNIRTPLVCRPFLYGTIIFILIHLAQMERTLKYWTGFRQCQRPTNITM